jgi:hypothetical protein
MTEREAIEQIEMIGKFVGYDNSPMVKRIQDALALAKQALENDAKRKELIKGCENTMNDFQYASENYRYYRDLVDALEYCEVDHG